MAKPSNPADNGRDPRGRFITGNRAGKGNPYHRRAHVLRAALFDDVTGEDIRQVVAGLVRLAKSGDLVAMKELLDRTVGDTVQVELLERIEALEQAIGELREKG